MKVLWPGIRRAEGKQKDKCVVARRDAEEVQSETVGDEQESDMRRDIFGGERVVDRTALYLQLGCVL